MNRNCALKFNRKKKFGSKSMKQCHLNWCVQTCVLYLMFASTAAMANVAYK